MGLDRKTGVGVGLGTMGIVWGVYGQALPPLADVRTGRPNDSHAAAAEKAARWVSAGLVTAVALITQDKTVFILGATAVIAFSVLYRHANMVEPESSRSMLPSSRTVVHSSGSDTAGTTPGF